MTESRDKQQLRSCIVCRKQRPQHELLGLTADGGTLRFDAGEGRSCYACVSRQCLAALGPRSLSRSFRRAIEAVPNGFLGTLHQLARRRVLETVGLARRSGKLDVGVERVLTYKSQKSAVVIANDLSNRSAAKVDVYPTFVDSYAIGRAAGLGKVGAVRIRSARLGQRANYWLGVWRETRPDPDDRRGSS